MTFDAAVALSFVVGFLSCAAAIYALAFLRPRAQPTRDAFSGYESGWTGSPLVAVEFHEGWEVTTRNPDEERRQAQQREQAKAVADETRFGNPLYSLAVLCLLPSVACAAGPEQLATGDLSGLSIDSLAQVLSSLGSVGFAVWYAWHTTTVTLPKRDEEHRLAVQSLVTDLRAKDERHEAAVVKLVTDFRASLKEVTDHCEQELAAISDNYRRETDRLAEEIKKSAQFRAIQLDAEGR